MKFNAYIDESGEAGIMKIRSGDTQGASPYFVMGAVVCEPTAEVHAKNCFLDFCETIGKNSWKHATDLSHSEKVLLARELGRQTVRYFAVVSNKATLDEYKSDIKGSAHKFYNKCAQYLLECICRYLGPKMDTPDDLSIIFEERNHDYDAMRRLLIKVKDNPIRPESRVLKNLNPFAISVQRKGATPMLDIADFVSHAVFQCANKSNNNFHIPEPRYFKELSTRFAGDKHGVIVGTGLYPIHSIDDLRLDTEVRQLLLNCRSKLPTPLRSPVAKF